VFFLSKKSVFSCQKSVSRMKILGIETTIIWDFGQPCNRDYTRQISLVESCRLRKTGSLPYDFEYGACNNFRTSSGSEKALLCFSDYKPDGCLR